MVDRACRHDPAVRLGDGENSEEGEQQSKHASAWISNAVQSLVCRILEAAAMDCPCFAVEMPPRAIGLRERERFFLAQSCAFLLFRPLAALERERLNRRIGVLRLDT